jgi:hypothetical protein
VGCPAHVVVFPLARRLFLMALGPRMAGVGLLRFPLVGSTSSPRGARVVWLRWGSSEGVLIWRVLEILRERGPALLMYHWACTDCPKGWSACLGLLIVPLAGATAPPLGPAWISGFRVTPLGALVVRLRGAHLS